MRLARSASAGTACCSWAVLSGVARMPGSSVARPAFWAALAGRAVAAMLTSAGVFGVLVQAVMMSAEMIEKVNKRVRESGIWICLMRLRVGMRRMIQEGTQKIVITSMP